jgi:hypothetical protein
MKEKIITEIATILQQVSEEDLKKIKDIIKDLSSSPYSETLITVHQNKIVSYEYKKKVRYTKEN